MESPKVSVIVPCFNHGAFLEEAVDSVFAQTCQDFEIIVVDDGSTDPATQRLFARFRRPRTQVLRSEHRGVAAARNLAIQQSRGRYISALDADDRLHPEFLARTTALLDADPGLAFCSTWLETFGGESWVWRPERCDLPALLAECVVLTAAPVRREAVLAVGGYDGERCAAGDEDWDLWLSLVERGLAGTIIPEVLFFYRRVPGSRSESCARGETRLALWRNLLAKHRASYLAHASEVFLRKERQCGEILRDNWLLEYAIEAELRPQFEARQAELARLQAALAEEDR